MAACHGLGASLAFGLRHSGGAVQQWRGRVNAAPFFPQKTVYGANVIVFEGILAFANKELLKVLLRGVF